MTMIIIIVSINVYDKILLLLLKTLQVRITKMTRNEL